MNKEKKKNRFGYYLLQCEVIAIVVALIIIYFSCNALYSKYILKVQENEAKHITTIEKRALPDKKQTDYEDKQSFYNLLGFKCATDTEIENGFRYSWIEDSKTGEMLTDSNRMALLILREVEGGPLASYTCDMNHMKEFWEKYDYPFYNTRPILLNMQDMYYENPSLLLQVAKGFDLYDYKVRDVYLKGNSFIVGSMDVYLEDENGNQGIFVGTLKASSEEVEGYTHIDEKEYSKYKTKMFISIGDTFDVNKDEIKEILADRDESVSYDSFPFPGNFRMLFKKNVTDRYGRDLTIYQTMSSTFVYDCRLYVWGICVAAGIVSLFIGLLAALIRYGRGKQNGHSEREEK